MDASLVLIISLVVPIATLILSHFGLKQKAGVDVTLDLRTQLNEQQRRMERLEDLRKQCEKDLETVHDDIRDLRARYEDQLELIRAENVTLLRQLAKLT